MSSLMNFDLELSTAVYDKRHASDRESKSFTVNIKVIMIINRSLPSS